MTSMVLSLTLAEAEAEHHIPQEEQAEQEAVAQELLVLEHMGLMQLQIQEGVLVVQQRTLTSHMLMAVQASSS